MAHQESVLSPETDLLALTRAHPHVRLLMTSVWKDALMRRVHACSHFSGICVSSALLFTRLHDAGELSEKDSYIGLITQLPVGKCKSMWGLYPWRTKGIGLSTMGKVEIMSWVSCWHICYWNRTAVPVAAVLQVITPENATKYRNGQQQLTSPYAFKQHLLLWSWDKTRTILVSDASAQKKNKKQSARLPPS